MKRRVFRTNCPWLSNNPLEASGLWVSDTQIGFAFRDRKNELGPFDLTLLAVVVLSAEEDRVLV
jgi:hypothetical protein